MPCVPLPRRNRVRAGIPLTPQLAGEVHQSALVGLALPPDHEPRPVWRFARRHWTPRHGWLCGRAVSQFPYPLAMVNIPRLDGTAPASVREYPQVLTAAIKPRLSAGRTLGTVALADWLHFAQGLEVKAHSCQVVIV